MAHAAGSLRGPIAETVGLRRHDRDDRRGGHGEHNHQHEVAERVFETSLGAWAGEEVVLCYPAVSPLEDLLEVAEALLDQGRDPLEGHGEAKVDPSLQRG